ncbi:hypothetical protein A2818_01755 [Candidatus Nomurabacteria bacterium RIFCSPHIGHO2_01_FULL_40_12]|uniref:Uncharacterized protein n=1 Tax=Candidatus Nomurabacteria bacterium RIFCSPHIGHO2_01_FULL_40_12 TaxID=1801737 RepID=A0A1F6V0N9_9BACT|nr:MAG: hypothetical protein A2818_01755 [Candidatus Nomurabacteria bacterium RIFCSPHIGHO2_01_FULL_40_12]
MKTCVFALVFVLSQVSFINGQTTTVVDARVGVKDGEATYRYVDAFQVHGRWIVPDVGYIDFGETKHYREWFVGTGYKPLVTKHVTIANEVYFVQSAGMVSGNAKYVQLWTGIFYQFTPKLGGETVFFPYVSLDDAGRKQWVVERAKLEYKVVLSLKLGGGYGAYQFGDKEWQHKPFITTTLTPAKGKFGSFEIWLQKLPKGNQIQLRYELVKNK